MPRETGADVPVARVCNPCVGRLLRGEGWYVETPTLVAEAVLSLGAERLVLHGEAWCFHAEPELGLESVAAHGLKTRATKMRRLFVRTREEWDGEGAF